MYYMRPIKIHDRSIIQYRKEQGETMEMAETVEMVKNHTQKTIFIYSKRLNLKF